MQLLYIVRQTAFLIIQSAIVLSVSFWTSIATQLVKSVTYGCERSSPPTLLEQFPRQEAAEVPSLEAAT